MKNLSAILLISLVCIYSTLYSQKPVSGDRAQIVAKNFYYEMVGLQKNLPYSSIEAELIRTESEKSTNYWYTFKMKPGGFVIVSANEAVVPVLGYSTDVIDSDDDILELPENFKGWMDHYKPEISDAIKNPERRNQQAQAEWDRLSNANVAMLSPKFSTNSVSPLIVSNWDQGKYYNQYCPVDAAGPDGHCVTGCVATAMGMLLYYYRWPLTGTGSYSYNHPTYGTVGANFGNATYDWNAMTNVLNTYNPAAAEMIFHMGASVDMDYGPSGSGMWNHKAAYSLRTYFKTVPQTTYLFRDSTNLDWDSIIVRHLDRKQILYYAGWAGVGSTSGHAFICDGYQDSTYFHFNWGWSASYNGYFYLNALNPGGNNFNYAQELILNIHPDTVNYTYPYYCNGLTTVHSPNGTLEDGSGPLKDYIPNAACSWLIDPQVNPLDSIKSITITFNRFDTETGQDLLTIYDGGTTSSPVLGNFSGGSLPASITSSSNKVLIVFSSNAAVNRSGWLLSYKSNFPTYCLLNNMFTEPSGHLSDGSGLKNYLNNTNCQFIIQPPNAAGITLHFNSFQTELSIDKLKVYQMDNPNTPIAEYSGSVIPPDISTNGSGMYLKFTTNGTNTFDGWDAYYTVTNLGITDEDDEGKFIFYPNPAADQFNLEISSTTSRDWKVEILSMEGRLLLEKNISVIPPSKKETFNIEQLSNGIYLIRLSNDSGVHQKKFTIQH
jgi:hypothetical protein